MTKVYGRGSGRLLLSDFRAAALHVRLAALRASGTKRKFYSERFIPKQPQDTEIITLSRTIGNDRVVDEPFSRFTHNIEMD
jgi:hypothetical protein